MNAASCHVHGTTGSAAAGLLLDKDGCEVSSFGTSLPMFTVTTEPIREVLILLGGPRGIESEEIGRLIDIFSGTGTLGTRMGPGFTRGLMKIRLPGGLHHSCVALNDLLSFHDKGAARNPLVLFDFRVREGNVGCGSALACVVLQC